MSLLLLFGGEAAVPDDPDPTPTSMLVNRSATAVLERPSLLVFNRSSMLRLDE